MDTTIANLDEQFAVLHQKSCDLIKRLTLLSLYQKPSGSEDSCGEQILRSAAVIERSFGGITANLWDDPFEWTLPETLNSPERIVEYLAEVECTRRQAFTLFTSDQDLSKEIMSPSGTVQMLPFLLDTLQRARHHQQRAVTAFARLQQNQLTTDN